MKQAIKREGYYAAVALVIFLCGSWIFSGFIRPAYNDWRYASSPYAPIENIHMVRDGDKLKFVGDLTKIAACNPEGLPPSYWLWRWGDNGVATDLIYLNGRPLASRNVIKVGETVRVGVLEANIPSDAVHDNLSVAIVIICDRGDGVARSYEIEPRLPIN